MASIAVLPILIGLAVDYAIQFQARYDEAAEDGLGGQDAARAAAARGGPLIATACLATAAGFLALLLSPTPMVRSFGLLLIAGVAIAFVLALTVGSAALSLRRRVEFASMARGTKSTRARRRVLGLRDRAAGRGARRRRRARARRLGGRHPDRDRLRRPRARPAEHRRRSRNSTSCRRRPASPASSTSRSSSDDLADPATIEWMAAFKRRVLRANGFSGENPSCLRGRDLSRARRSRTSSSAKATTLTRRRDRGDAGGALALRAAPGRAARPARPASSATRR